MSNFLAKDLEEMIRVIPDFPKKGIQFLDLTTVFNRPSAFKKIIDLFYEEYKDKGIKQVIGIEARGFITASALAYKLDAGVTLIRKPGKLPYKTISESYALEYGTNEIHIHEDAVEKGDKVLLIDDLLATGGTMSASINLVEKLGGDIAGVAFIVELGFLGGKDKLANHPIFSLITKN